MQSPWESEALFEKKKVLCFLVIAKPGVIFNIQEEKASNKD